MSRAVLQQFYGVLVVIDGNWYAYRLHHRLRGLHGAGDAPIGACFGFADLFKRLRDDPRITHWAIVFDHPDKSFRHRLDADYKAHRPPMPDDLRQQWPSFIPLAEATGIPVLSLPDLEGDDTLAGFAAWGRHYDIDTRLATVDKDLEQVIDAQCHLWDPFSDSVRDAADVYRRRGVTPDQIADWLCLCGDTADNILGAPGIGPKRAEKLLREHGNLSAIYAHSHRLPPAQRRGILDLRRRHDAVNALVQLRPPTVEQLPEPRALCKSDQPAIPDQAMRLYRSLGLVPERFFPNLFKQKTEKNIPPRPQCPDLWQSTFSDHHAWSFDRSSCADHLAWWRDQAAASDAAAAQENIPTFQTAEKAWQWLDDQAPHPEGTWKLPSRRRLARFQGGRARLVAQRMLAHDTVACLTAWLEAARPPQIIGGNDRLRRLPEPWRPPADLPHRYHPWRHLRPPADHSLVELHWPRLEWAILAAMSGCPTCERLASGINFSENNLDYADPGAELAAKAAAWNHLLTPVEGQEITGSRWLKKSLDVAQDTGSISTSFGREITIDRRTLNSPWSYRSFALAFLQGSAVDAMDWWTTAWIYSGRAPLPLSCSGLQFHHQAVLAVPNQHLSFLTQLNPHAAKKELAPLDFSETELTVKINQHSLLDRLQQLSHPELSIISQ